MPQALTARQYAWVRRLLIALHLTTLFSSICMLVIPLADRRGYQQYFSVVKVQALDVSYSTDFMVASGAVGLIQPLLFLCIHIIYPYFRKQQWAMRDAVARRNSMLEQQHQQPPTQRRGSANAASEAPKGLSMNFPSMSSSNTPGPQLHRPVSGASVAEGASLQGKADGVARAETPTSPAENLPLSNPFSFPPGLGPSKHGSFLSLNTSSLSPQSTPRQLPLYGVGSSSPLPKNGTISPRSICLTATYNTDIRIPSSRSIAQTPTNLVSTVPPAFPSSSFTKETPVEVAVSSPRLHVRSCSPVDSSQVFSSAEAGGVLKSRDGNIDVSSGVSTPAAITGHAECVAGISAVGDRTFPHSSDASRVIVDTSSGVTMSEFGGKTPTRHHRSVSVGVVPHALVALDEVGGSVPVVSTASARPSDAVLQPNISPGKGAASWHHTPVATLAGSSMSVRTQPLSSALASDAGEPGSFQPGCTNYPAAASCKLPAGDSLAMISRTVLPRAPPVRERDVTVMASEEVQPAKVSVRQATQHSLRDLDCAGNSHQRGSSASAFSRRLPWFIPTTTSLEAPPQQVQSPRQPSASRLSISVQSLPPGVLHTYLNSEPTFRSLLTAYYIFASVGILLMYFFGVFWVVRKELHEVRNLALIAEGWNRVFIYPMGDSTDAQLCRMQLRRRCSGGNRLCNATYDSAESAHEVRCPFCTTSQQEIIRTFTELCSVAYNPGTRYSNVFIGFLVLTVLASLLSLFLAVFSCGKGVLASVGYAALSERDAEAEEKMHAMADAGGLFILPDNTTASQCSHPPSYPSPREFRFSAAGEALSPTTPTTVAPSRERLMHTFEGLHEPSAALLPPLSVVMAEMSSDSSAPVLQPVNMTRRTFSIITEEARDGSMQAMVDGVDDTNIPMHTHSSNVAGSTY